MGRPLLLKIAPDYGGPGPHLIHGPLAHLSPQPKWHLDRFSRFYRAHYYDRQRDRQTTLLGL